MSTLFFLGLLLSCDTARQSVPWSSNPKNIVVIVIDALRADHLGCYGYARATSPAIDTLASDGVLFERAISQSTFTSCSVASLFTGLNPHHHGMYWGSLRNQAGSVRTHRLGQEHTTLAELLRDQGYTCMAWFQNKMLRKGLGFDQGFAGYTELEGNKQEVGGRIVDRFLDWHARRKDKTPFFAYLHLLNVHGPYAPKPPFDSMFGDPGARRSLPAMNWATWSPWVRQVNSGQRVITPGQLAGLKDAYDGAIRTADTQLGRLFRTLRERGIFSDTVIVLTSDHGDGFMEHRFLDHGRPPYIELVHVPLIIKLPSQAFRGKRVHTQVRLIDVLPTLLEFTGPGALEREPTDLDGSSLLPVIQDNSSGGTGASRHRRAISEILVGGKELVVSVREGRYAFLHWASGTEKLYDDVRDPQEQDNLAPGPVEEIVHLRRQTRAIEMAAARVRSSGEPIEPDVVKRIRSLGYLQ
ncbi:MAG: sulfatase [Acidobacteria bacterium]|nr:sulfatase [Acidobacteriota bacterium]